MDEKPDRFLALDSWRGLCALLVALFHFPILGEIRSIGLVSHAYLFVDFFFVLSGFVIGRRYEQTMPAEGLGFLIRRIGRIWPLHIAILAGFVAISIVQSDLGSDERHSVMAIFTNLAMVHGLGMHTDLTWNGPSWSISVEFLLYLMFAALSLSPHRTVIYVGLICGSLLILTQWAPSGMASTYDFGLFRGLAGFFTGVLLARGQVRSYGPRAEPVMVGVILLFVMADTMQFLSPLVFGAAVCVFAGSSGPVSRMLCTRPMLLLGQWSYSVYMVHAAVIAVIFMAAKPLGLTRTGPHTLISNVPTELAVAAGYLVVVITVSALTYTLIEVPSRNWFNKLAKTAAGQPARAPA